MTFMYFVAWLVAAAVTGIGTGFFIYAGKHDDDEDEDDV